VNVPIEDAVSIQFVRSGGPGGQNVNKVASAAQARLAIALLKLPDPIADRLRRLAGSRLNDRDEIVVFANRFRSQARNRDDAIARLADLVERARHAPRRRIATRRSAAVRARRANLKQRQGERTRLRRTPDSD
jgi:ribosome-associated protein